MLWLSLYIQISCCSRWKKLDFSTAEIPTPRLQTSIWHIMPNFLSQNPNIFASAEAICAALFQQACCLSLTNRNDRKSKLLPVVLFSYLVMLTWGYLLMQCLLARPISLWPWSLLTAVNWCEVILSENEIGTENSQPYSPLLIMCSPSKKRTAGSNARVHL